MRKIALLSAAFAAVATMSAKIVTQPVAYEHAGVKLEGLLTYDDAKVSPAKKAPGVLVIPEWWGLTDYPKGRAQQVAALGYVAFAADMYGAGVVTGDPKKAGELAGQFYGKPLMAARAQAGLDQLLKTGLVDTGRVAAIGFHGGLIPVPADAAAKTKAKILVCHGAIDPFVSKEDVDAFTKAMNDGKFDYQFVSYAGAVHAFSNPGADQIAKTAGIPIAYNAAADRRSWAHMQAFFAEIFAAKK
jgi:dienelactone hydrolase